MSASYPPRRLMDLNVDLARERATEHHRSLRRRRRWLTVLLTTVAIAVCLVLGIGLGWLAGSGGDRAATSGTEASGAVPAPPAAAATVGARGGVVSQTEAHRAVERRLAGVALAEAAQLVARGVTAGRAGEVPARTEVLAEPIVEEGVASAPVEAGSREGGERAEGSGQPSAASVETAETAVVVEPERRESAAGNAARGARDREGARGEVTPDRWRDPNVEEIDYDFSVPFEERREESREDLLRIDQIDPY